MPRCFQLIRKSEPENGPVSLTKIDEEICAHLGVSVDEKKWCCAWYDTIGLSLACGQPLEEVVMDCRADLFAEPDGWNHVQLLIAEFIKEHFTSNSFYQHKF